MSDFHKKVDSEFKEKLVLSQLEKNMKQELS